MFGWDGGALFFSRPCSAPHASSAPTRDSDLGAFPKLRAAAVSVTELVEREDPGSSRDREPQGEVPPPPRRPGPPIARRQPRARNGRRLDLLIPLATRRETQSAGWKGRGDKGRGTAPRARRVAALRRKPKGGDRRLKLRLQKRRRGAPL